MDYKINDISVKDKLNIENFTELYYYQSPIMINDKERTI